MKLSQLLLKTSLSHSQKIGESEIGGISRDSRTIVENMLFFALAEDTKQRRAHLQEALKKGACFVICPQVDQELGLSNCLYSCNPREDYGVISANWFGNPSKAFTLIGVTGTNGKTTTTHMIKSMIENYGDGRQRKVGLIGTNENQIANHSFPSHHTTPDAYELQALFREMEIAGCSHVVMEVSSHGLVQHRCASVKFAMGIFTNLTQDHLDYHKSMEAYQEAKGLLFRQSEIGIFNIDDPAGRAYADLRKRKNRPFFTYSENKKEANLFAENLQLYPEQIKFDCQTGRETTAVTLPIPGGFSLYNGLATLSCGLALGFSLPKIGEAFLQIKGVKGRVEVLPVEAEYTVLIDYAHTPNALENILMTAQNITTGRLICVFGCGGNRDQSKRAIMGEIAEDLSDIVVVTSDNPRFENPEEIIADILQGMTREKEKRVLPNRKEAIFYALSQAKDGDLVLLAGKGHECYQEIQGERFPFDEREIVQAYFQQEKKSKKKTSK